LKIDIIIPLITKDLAVFPYVVDSARRYIMHPLGEIIVVAPDDAEIRNQCAIQNCRFADETTVLPFSKNQINYHIDGMDRSGWIYQQLLKLSGDLIASQRYFLVLDADTVLIRPQIFIINRKLVFNCSDEYHPPYFEHYQKIFGVSSRAPISFVSHYMLFDRNVLQEIRASIEKRHQVFWSRAILNALDRSQGSSFSEFEMYGNYMWQTRPQEIFLEYSFNVSCHRSDLAQLPALVEKYKNGYKSLSFHSWRME
jgi:hypothetical protein